MSSAENAPTITAASQKFNFPEDFSSWKKNPTFGKHMLALLLGVAVGAALLGLGLLYMSFQKNDLITWFYLGLGFTFLLVTPIVVAIVWFQTKKDESKLSEFYYRFAGFTTRQYGLTLTRDDIHALLEGKRIDINFDGTRQRIYVTSLIDGSDVQISYTNADQELPYERNNLTLTTFDYPKRFTTKSNVNKTALGTFAGTSILLTIVLSVLAFLLKLDDTASSQNGNFLLALVSWRPFFLSLVLAMLLGAATIPLVIRNTKRTPVKLDVVVNSLVAMARKRYNLVITKPEAWHLLSKSTPLNVKAFGGRISVYLSVLTTGEDVRIMLDRTSTELATRK